MIIISAHIKPLLPYECIYHVTLLTSLIRVTGRR